NTTNAPFTTGSGSASIGTTPGTTVSFTYNSPVVCSGTTYNFASATPASPFTSGATGSNTTVTGHYTAPADLVITKTHVGNFTVGQTGAAYTITVKNNGTLSGAASLVTVADTLPSGLT